MNKCFNKKKYSLTLCFLLSLIELKFVLVPLYNNSKWIILQLMFYINFLRDIRNLIYNMILSSFTSYPCSTFDPTKKVININYNWSINQYNFTLNLWAKCKRLNYLIPIRRLLGLFWLLASCFFLFGSGAKHFHNLNKINTVSTSIHISLYTWLSVCPSVSVWGGRT